jgi:hypothetical protein
MQWAFGIWPALYLMLFQAGLQNTSLSLSPLHRQSKVCIYQHYYLILGHGAVRLGITMGCVAFVVQRNLGKKGVILVWDGITLPSEPNLLLPWH